MKKKLLENLSSHARDQLLELEKEKLRRDISPLKLYSPYSYQVPFHQDTEAYESIVLGGNRCLSGDTLIYDPVLDCERRLDEIDSAFHVLSWNGEEVCVKPATKPFVKGFGDIYEVSLSNGQTIRTTLHHRVLTTSGWKSVSDALHLGLPLYRQESIEGTSPSVSRQGADRSTQTTPDCLDGCLPDRRRCDEQPHFAQEVGQSSSPSQVDALGCSLSRWHSGGLADGEECILPYRRSPHPSSPYALGRFWGHGGASECRTVCKPCSLPLRVGQESGLSQQRFSFQPRTVGEDGQRPNRCDSSEPCKPPLGEFAYITSVRLLGKQSIWDITVADTSSYWLGGVLHHNSGKTTAAAMEFSWAITGTHPVEGKYPKENGLAWVVGQNWSHIGRVIVPMLLKAGVFKIIRDLDTGLWRAFDFVKDAGREDESKPSPPLIPERMIKQKSWVLKSANMLSTLELTNGWVVNLFSSDAEPPQGNKVNLAWVDEDINSSGNWVTELQARLADLRGRLVWSAMPHSRTDALVGLADRAEKAAEKGDTRIKLYRWRFLDNVAIPQDQKQLMIERWAAAGGEEEVRRRAEGEFADNSLLVFPTFNLSVHAHDLPGGQVPADWCRYMVVDPGHAVCAVLFAAVPPDNSMVLLYDELYVRNASATILAEEVLKKVSGQVFHAFLIDAHGARITDIGSGKSPQLQYSEAFAKLGIQSTVTGHSFIPGCDDIAAGIQAVREAMYIRQNGTCRFKIIRGAVPNLIRELKRYKFKVSRSSGTPVVTDIPNKNSGDFHLVDNLRYLFAYEPEYHKPPEDTVKPWWWEMVKRRQKEKNRTGSVYLAPNSYSFEFTT